MPGVVEHGLFIGMAAVALIGKGDQVIEVADGEGSKPNDNSLCPRSSVVSEQKVTRQLSTED